MRFCFSLALKRKLAYLYALQQPEANGAVAYAFPVAKIPCPGIEQSIAQGR